MNIYKVKQGDLIGDIKGFPIEVVQKMVERQVEQKGKADVCAFQKYRYDGFEWAKTIEGKTFWGRVTDGKFNVFFEKYPKCYPNKNVYYRGVEGRGDEIIKALESLGANNKNNCTGAYEDHLYYINKDNSINSCYNSSTLADILRRGFTELFLSPIETLEIDGKKFRKDEIVEVIKEKGLKEIK